MSSAASFKKDHNELIRNISFTRRFPPGVKKLEQKIRFIMWCDGPQTIPTLASKIDTSCTAVKNVLLDLLSQGMVVVQNDTSQGMGSMLTRLYALPK